MTIVRVAIDQTPPMPDRPAPTTILHIALPDDWEAAQRAGSYTISSRGVTLAEEGFIHCSHPRQAEGVANRYYADLDRLLLLEVDVAALRSDVIEEPPFAGADDRFPHIYGPIDLDAVMSVNDWRRAQGAAWTLPPAITDR